MCSNGPFEVWNLRLLQKYFSAGSDGREIFLATSPEELDNIGQDLGGDTGFLEAVRHGPSWPLPEDFVGKIRRLTEQRTSTGRRSPRYVDPGKQDSSYKPGGEVNNSAPTYLPYLAALTRAAAVADASGYYARLREDLGLPAGWGSGQMARIIDTWEDLQSWTKSTQGKYGSFVARQLGGYTLIGLPKSQVILSSSDVPAIHQLFDEFGAKANEAISDDKIEEVLAAIRNGGRRLSSNLTQAASDESYLRELRALLAAIHQGWDGVASSPSARDTPIAEGGGEATLGIYLADGALPWRLQIRVASEELDDGFDQSTGDMAEWRASQRADRAFVVASRAPSAHEFLSGKVWRFELFGQERTLARRNLWVLRGSTHGSNFELWEGELSPYGNVYLLVGADRSVELSEYLERAAPKYQEVLSDGLPEGWRLIWIEDNQELSDAQQALPNGGGSARSPRSVCFEGGTKLNQGGIRQYLHYDLPSVVVMASKVAALECDGTALSPCDGDAQAGHSIEGIPVSSPDRHFELPSKVEAGGIFLIRALDEQGLELGKGLELRVVNTTGESPAEFDQAGSLNKFGRMTAAEDGLSGGLRKRNQVLSLANAPDESRLSVNSDLLDDARVAGALLDNPAALFLDALANEKKRINYGKATRLIERLVSAKGGAIEPWRMLAELSSRGHIELERNQGAITYVHPVRPAVYELAARTGDARLFGVLGTLSIAHWRELRNQRIAWLTSHVFAYGREKQGCKFYLPTARLRSRLDDATLKPMLQGIGFELLSPQGAAIAQWSAGFDEVEEEVLKTSSVDPPLANPRNLKLFDPASGFFQSCRNGIQRNSDSAQRMMFYQYEDPFVQGRKIHLLAHARGFSPVLDVQWAKWLAVMCRFPSGRQRIPITYKDGNGRREVWLPSRMRLPSTLERALILCNGGPPDEFKMEATMEDQGFLSLMFQRSRLDQELRVDADIYSTMASGNWLVYGWVPPAVASVIRKKLVQPRRS